MSPRGSPKKGKKQVKTTREPVYELVVVVSGANIKAYQSLGQELQKGRAVEEAIESAGGRGSLDSSSLSYGNAMLIMTGGLEFLRKIKEELAEYRITGPFIR